MLNTERLDIGDAKNVVNLASSKFSSESKNCSLRNEKI